MQGNGLWYLVQCKPRDSFRAAMHLANQGYTYFHPTYPIQQKKAGKLHTTIAPLFPHYLFILLSDQDAWSPIRSTRGVSRIVHFNSKPASLADHLVFGIQQHCAKLNGEAPESLLKPGDRVVITAGCFKELEAIVTAATGEERVSLLINLFNRQHEVELPLHSVEACA